MKDRQTDRARQRDRDRQTETEMSGHVAPPGTPPLQATETTTDTYTEHAE